MPFQCTACDKVLRNPLVYSTHFHSKHPDLPLVVPAPLEEPAAAAAAAAASAAPAPKSAGQPGQVVSFPAYRNPPQPEDASSKRDQFAAVAMNIGIKEPIARQVAWYLVENYDIDKPLRLAEGLNNKTELNPAQRRELWTTWTNRSNRNLSDDLKREVISTLDPDAVSDKGHGSMEEQRFRLDGYLVVADDNGKFTWGQAKMMVQQLKDVNQDSLPKNGDQGGVMTELTRAALREKPDQVLPTITAMKEWIRPQEEGGSSKAQADLMRLLMESEARALKTSIDLYQTQSKSEMDRMRDHQDRQIEKLTELVTRMATSRQEPASPWEALDRVLPGASAKFMELILNPRSNEDAIKINLGDEGGSMSIDTWERVEAIKAKRANMNWIRSVAPEFLDLGKAMVMALNTKKQEADLALAGPEEQIQSGEIVISCVGCRTQLIMPEGTHMFACNDCGTKQDTEGRVYKDKERAAPQVVSPSDYEPQEAAPSLKGLPDDPQPKPFPPVTLPELAGVA